MSTNCFISLCLFLAQGKLFAVAVSVDYMTDKCGMITRTDSWQRLESTPTLSYPQNVDCTFTVTTAPSKRLLVILRRFQLENSVFGSCVDFVDFHDGLDLNKTRLNPHPLCGTVLPPSSFTSSGDALTVHFRTDNTAQDRGFDLVFVSFKTGACSDEEFACDSGICIPAYLACDRFNQCGDYSDEKSCQEPAIVTTSSVDVALIVGVCIGLGSFVAAVVIALCLYRYYKWRRFLLESEELPDITIKDPEPTYPVTWKYWKWPIVVGKNGDEFKWGARNDGYKNMEVNVTDMKTTSNEVDLLDDIPIGGLSNSNYSSV